MSQNKISSKKSKKHLFFISILIGLILFAAVCRDLIRQMSDVPAMEDIYFQVYDNQNQETVIYKYNASAQKVYEVGKVAGYFHNCKIDSEKKYITGVSSPWGPKQDYDAESCLESGIVRYSIEDGAVVLLRSAQQMSIGNKKRIVWEYSYPFDNGNKMLMCYKDQELIYLLYDLETGKAKKLDMPKMSQGVYDIRNGNIWYPVRNKVMQYNVKTNERKEILQKADQCAISDDGRKAADIEYYGKRIVIYDVLQEREIGTLKAGWNRTFDNFSSYSCGWEQSGNYFCYVEHFNKFFGSSDTRIKVYNLQTKVSKCIYLQRNAFAATTFEFIRNAD